MAKGRVTDRGSGSISRLGIELNDRNGYVRHHHTASSCVILR